jgi:hypothetical protein
MRMIRASALSIVLATLAAATVGQESEQPAQPAAPAQPAPAPAPPPNNPPPDAARSAPSTETPPARGVVRGDEFIPTQELQADEEATFPVDI